jgi:Peptidase family M23
MRPGATFSQIVQTGACLLGLAQSGLAIAGAGDVPPPPTAVLALPTENRALFENRPEAFFMGVDRHLPDGSDVFVWEGGQFGFVRNPLTWSGGTVFTRFHEGVDIAPMARDAAEEPLDLVHAMAAGKVVFTSASAGSSNYGNYIVIEHDWGYGPLYTLYAHLMRMDVQEGRQVALGEVLGRMGYSGSGINRRRAHVHVELDFMLSRRFADWQRTVDAAAAENLFHGWNLAGIDIVAFLKAATADPRLTVPGFLALQPVYYRVRVPRGEQPPDLLARHPWLWAQPRPRGYLPPPAEAPSWEISFTDSGLPIDISPSQEMVEVPVVSWVEPFNGSHSWHTMDRLDGSGSTAKLTKKGRDYVNLITGQLPPPPIVTAAKAATPGSGTSATGGKSTAKSVPKLAAKSATQLTAKPTAKPPTKPAKKSTKPAAKSLKPAVKQKPATPAPPVPSKPKASKPKTPTKKPKAVPASSVSAPPKAASS